MGMPYWGDNPTLAQQQANADWQAQQNPNAPGGGQNLTPQQQQTWNQMWQQQQLQMQQQNNAQLQALRMEMERERLANPQQQFSPVTKDASGKVMLRDEFRLSGPESYLQSRMSKQQLEEAGQRDLAAQGLAQGLAQMQAQSAMRGGSRSGAQASLQRQGLRELMASRQGVARQGALERAAITTEGEELRRKTEAYNLENMLKGGESADKFALDVWTRNKAAKAAEQSAQATRAAAQDSSKK